MAVHQRVRFGGYGLTLVFFSHGIMSQELGVIKCCATPTKKKKRKKSQIIQAIGPRSCIETCGDVGIAYST